MKLNIDYNTVHNLKLRCFSNKKKLNNNKINMTLYRWKVLI